MLNPVPCCWLAQTCSGRACLTRPLLLVGADMLRMCMLNSSLALDWRRHALNVHALVQSPVDELCYTMMLHLLQP